MNEALLEKYGLPGIVIGGLAWFVIYLMKQHKAERQDWQKVNERQQDDTNKNIKENTHVLSELNTLIKSLKK